MSSTESDVLSTAVDRVLFWLAVAAQIDTIRADIQNLVSMVRPIADKERAEDAIRQHPLSAVAIAAGFGFLFWMFTRR
jgi:ElaB/YqjD/DUF883 family membrane-anchored ribosome-binding protein